MSQFLTQYDTTSKDYEWYVENIRPGMEHYADCVDKGEYCIDLIMDKANKNEAWAVALNGFYPAAANDCPTNSMTINNAQYSADGKCYGVCDMTATKIEQQSSFYEVDYC
eukprot:266977_1